MNPKKFPLIQVSITCFYKIISAFQCSLMINISTKSTSPKTATEHESKPDTVFCIRKNRICRANQTIEIRNLTDCVEEAEQMQAQDRSRARKGEKRTAKTQIKGDRAMEPTQIKG